MTTSRENPALAAMQCNQSLVTLNSSNSMSGSFHCTSQLTVIKSWFTLIRSKNNDEIIWNLPSADVHSLKSCKKPQTKSFILASLRIDSRSVCVVNISLPCPHHTTWPPCLQASALWLTVSKRWKEKPQYNKNCEWEQLPASRDGRFIFLSSTCALSGVRRGQSRCIQQPFTSWPLDTSLLCLHTDCGVSSHQQTLK